MTRSLLLSAMLICTVMCTSASRHHHTGLAIGGEGRCLVVQPAPESPQFIAVEARCAIVSSAASRRSLNAWSLVWDVRADGYSYATLEFDNRNHTDGIDADRAILRVGHIGSGTDSVTATTAITSGISFDYRHNSLLMEWSEGETRIYGGNRGMSLLLRFPSPPPAGGSCGIMSRSAVAPLDIVTEARQRPDTRLHTGLTIAGIDSLITAASGDPLTGYWEYLDRDNDPDRARPGGRYSLAVIPAGPTGNYDIIYLGGAQVNAGQWLTGMIKGRLSATPFMDHYTLTWYDAMCQDVVSELHADLTRPAILTLNFPLMRTSMRFARCKIAP